MRYLHITENLDAYFLPSMRTLHLHFGEVKEYVTKYRRHIYPRLITLPLSAETEWSIYFQTSELTAFMLHYKGDTFLRVEDYGKLGTKVTLAIA